MPQRDDKDAHLFRTAVGQVKPVKSDTAPPSRKRPEAKARFRRADEHQVLKESLGEGRQPADLETGEELAYRRAGVGESVYRKLRRGQISVAAEVDLHGMSAAQAKQALQAFLLECQQLDRRCVRVIHGKGRRSGSQGPVLKNKVNKWLRRWDPVLAFHSARPVDGGTGAVYVLLKR